MVGNIDQTSVNRDQTKTLFASKNETNVVPRGESSTPATYKMEVFVTKKCHRELHFAGCTGPRQDSGVDIEEALFILTNVIN